MTIKTFISVKTCIVTCTFWAVFALGMPQAMALSCPFPRVHEDPVISARDSGQGYWFGKARVTKLPAIPKGLEPVQAEFEIIETYLSNRAIDGTLSVHVSAMFRSWSPLVRHTVPFEGDFHFRYDATAGTWQYAGPGGCTHFSDQIWQNLRRGDYQE